LNFSGCAKTENVFSVKAGQRNARSGRGNLLEIAFTLPGESLVFLQVLHSTCGKLGERQGTLQVKRSEEMPDQGEAISWRLPSCCRERA